MSNLSYSGGETGLDQGFLESLARAVGHDVVRQLMDGHGRARGPGPAIPARFLVLEEFLVAQDWAMVLEYTLSQEGRFLQSQVIRPGNETGGVNYDQRRSRVLYDFGDVQSMIEERVTSVFSRAVEKLGYSPFPIAKVEAQITASNDGEYFKLHNDNTHEALQHREITFVYYYFREPKGYRGGELRLYDTRMENGTMLAANSFSTIVPQQNQLVLFPSFLMHELMLTTVPSQAFADSRFTINGWLHRSS